MARGRRKQQDGFDPVLSRGIISVLLFALAVIISLSFFDKAGDLGVFLDEWLLSSLFGSMRYAVPAVILYFMWSLHRDTSEDEGTPTHTAGAMLFFLTLSSLMHLGFSPDDMWNEALNGHGGGIFGMAAWPLKTYLGSIASVVLLISFAAVSLILLFKTRALDWLMVHKKIFAGFSWIGRGVRSAFIRVPNSSPVVRIAGEYAEDDEEEEEYEETTPLQKKTFAVSSAYDDEEDGEDEDEEEYEEEEETSTVSSDGAPDWTKNVIIRDLPQVNLLTSKKSKPTSGDIQSNAQMIQDTLRQFNIDVEMGEIRVGPTVTQYSLKPSKGVKLSRITGLSNDLALALAAHPIRIEAPIPGQALVGIEVPNQKTAMVTLKELLESKEYTGREHNMMMALGKDVGGKIWMADLPKMPHLLVAGTTGSGKTVCVNTILLSLLYQNTAETLRLIMVDPKRVELTLYNGIPHLLTPVITNASQTVNALKWAIGEMERRFEVLAAAGNRDITSYNKLHPEAKLPYIVFVIDELADLMATSGNEVEAGIIRIAQMARAVGIHLIVATQRPSVDVITGLMKANIPARIAFSVASVTDSRTILDTPGAEKLLGRGDMLFSTAALSKPVRLQGAYVTEDEMKNVVEYLKGDEEPVYDTSIIEKPKSGGGSMFGGPGEDQDAMIEEAKQAILDAGKASASFLQRRLKVGYARAARILDELEEMGFIGPADGAKPREILVSEREVQTSMNMGGKLNVYNTRKKELVESMEMPEPEDEEDADMEDEADEEEEEQTNYHV